MPHKRLIAAAAVLLAAAYLYCTLPSFAEAGVPALHRMIDERQLQLVLPEAVTRYIRPA